jgi:hypothetical protein
VHPEIATLGIFENEKHPRFIVEMLTKHQSNFPLLLGIRHFDRNARTRFAVRRNDRDARPAHASEQRGHQDQEREGSDARAGNQITFASGDISSNSRPEVSGKNHKIAGAIIQTMVKQQTDREREPV